MTLRALCILHPGFEEIEAITPIDLLRRAGVEVTVAGIHGIGLVEGKNGIRVQASESLEEVKEDHFDLILLPGGPGISHIRNHPTLSLLLRNSAEKDVWLACICAAPLLLLDAGLIEDLNYTAHPSTIQSLPDAKNEPVVVHRHIITSQGAGTSTQFSLALIEALSGKKKADDIAESICWIQN
jgi:4-methyl-5(b-hydroxyethyl)-thiazole monophosphate biosynthesis